jgi:hypothetical protein
LIEINVYLTKQEKFLPRKEKVQQIFSMGLFGGLLSEISMIVEKFFV